MLRKALMTTQSEPVEFSGSKVTVVGTGQVGMAIAFGLLTQKVCNELALVDKMEERLLGETLDLQHGSTFLHSSKICCSTDYAVTSGSKLCIVTAGAAQKPGESRLDLVHRNVLVFKNIIPELIKFNKETVLLIVTNPVDIMTYVAWRLSGLPRNRVIGSGTTLDSSRFRVFIGEKLGVCPSSVHAWIIGEHGDSSVPVWSGVNVAGVRLRDLNPDIGTDKDEENWKHIHEKVVSSAYDVIKLKGCTAWGVAASVANIVSAILGNTLKVLPVSTYIKGCKHGTDKEVFLSLPCILGENGVTHIIKQPLTEDEKAQLHRSANIMHEIQRELEL